MKNRLIIKDNTLINSNYFLSLTEKRLMLFCISQAQNNNQEINSNEYIEIQSSNYSNFFKLNEKTIYRDLKTACDSLMKRIFSYKFIDENGKLILRKSNWVQSIDYIDGAGMVRILFTKEIIPFISHLEKNFTSYYLNHVAQMTSVYAIRLYELLIAWRSTGKTPVIEIEDFRQKLGISPDEYKEMTNFKKRVLNVAVNQINELSNINIEVEQHKQGRNITGFSFKLTEKNKSTKDKKTDKTLTDSQRHLFASKLSIMPEMSKYSEGTESYDQFAIRIADMLTEPKKFKNLYPLLEKAGFSIEK